MQVRKYSRYVNVCSTRFSIIAMQQQYWAFNGKTTFKSHVPFGWLVCMSRPLSTLIKLFSFESNVFSLCVLISNFFVVAKTNYEVNLTVIRDILLTYCTF